MKNNYIKSQYQQIWIENEIIYNLYDSGLKSIDINIAKHLVEDRLKISDKVRRPIFIDTSNVKSITREAEKYLATQNATKYLSAAAILTHSRVAKLLYRIYISLSRPKIPTKVFSDKEEALGWLEQHKVERLS